MTNCIVCDQGLTHVGSVCPLGPCPAPVDWSSIKDSDPIELAHFRQDADRTQWFEAMRRAINLGQVYIPGPPPWERWC